MPTSECDELLAWAMPRLGMRWAGFRRVKRQVCRRVGARIRELGLTDAHAYAAYLERTPGEWPELEARCGITISRLYRDREVFECLRQHVLPALARERETLRVWSAGCASGEEPYSIALMWELELAAGLPGHALRVLATDRDPHLLQRAARGCYRRSSLRELPAEWIERGFANERGDAWCLRPELRRSVTFERQDLRRALPAGTFDMVLCRNLAFSYFELAEQRSLLQQLLACLHPRGYLVIGLRERLPDDVAGLRRLPQCEYVFERG